MTEATPQARKLIGPPHAHLDGPCTDACFGPQQADKPFVPQRYLDVIDRAADREHSLTGTVARTLAEILELHRADVLAELRGQGVPVLDLVQQYGVAMQGLGYSAGVGQRTDIDAKKAGALLDRIAALLPQQPVQARDIDGKPWWMHPCGAVYAKTTQPGPYTCEVCNHKPGPWRPLLVGGTAASESECGAVFTHPTKGAQPPCSRPHGHGGEADPSYHSNGMFKWLDQPDLIAQVMEALGVDRPEDVLGAIETIRANRDHNLNAARDLRRMLDAARAEAEQLRYERRLLGSARMTLDLIAAGTPDRWDGLRAEAERTAQAIVDEIGHPVTDEPALGPTLREENDHLKAKLSAIANIINEGAA
jgi:hypothetical protein